ncbi:hypothetical protein C8R45DRAFT_1046205, partial [Mycena sanguinolenta]
MTCINWLVALLALSPHLPCCLFATPCLLSCSSRETQASPFGYLSTKIKFPQVVLEPCKLAKLFSSLQIVFSSLGTASLQSLCLLAPKTFLKISRIKFHVVLNHQEHWRPSGGRAPSKD